MTTETPANADEEILTVVLKASKDWFDALDQWRDTRGNVLHLGKPSRPASIRYLVRLGMAADAEAASRNAEIANLRLKRGRGKSGRRATA